MTRRLVPTAIGASAVALLFSMVPAMAVDQAVQVQGAPVPRSEPVPTVARGVIVKATTSSKARQGSLAATADRALPRSVEVTGTTAGLEGISLVRFDRTVPAERASSVAVALEARADVEWAIPNYVIRTQAAPVVTVNDPQFPAQRNLWDATAASPGGFSIKAPALWQATKGSPSVVVAVIDTGIVADHPDLAGRLVSGYDFVDQDCVVDDSGEFCDPTGTFVNAGDGSGMDPDPSDPGDWVDEQNAELCGFPAGDEQDSSWHGTHVAGIIAAKADNGYGIAGVAPGVKIQPVRVMGHCGGEMWDIAAGILWASGSDLGEELDPYYAGIAVNRTPAKIANLSLGFDVPQEYHAEVCDFFGYTADVARGHGMALVAAAGNSSSTTVADADLAAPASCDGFLSVAASSTTGHRSWYSNGGLSVDVAAPGGDTLVEGSSDAIWSTMLGAKKAPNSSHIIGALQGTSMAAPAVAGAMALLASLGIRGPDALDAAVRSAVSPFPTYDQDYDGRDLGHFVAADLNCTRQVCGQGLFDLSKVTALRGGPRVAVGATAVKATSRGLVGPSAASTITWWRGSKRISSNAAYRLTGADLRQTLTARQSITSGPSAGMTAATTITVPRSRTRTAFSMPRKVKKSKRVMMVVKVSASVGDPLGTIRVYDGRKRIATAQMSVKHQGRTAIRLPALKKGQHRIRVVFSGSPRFDSSSASRKIVRSR